MLLFGWLQARATANFFFTFLAGMLNHNAVIGLPAYKFSAPRGGLAQQYGNRNASTFADLPKKFAVMFAKRGSKSGYV